MQRIDVLTAIAQGRAKFWPTHDVLVIDQPGDQPVRMFRRGTAEYTAACDLVDADLATQEVMPLVVERIPLAVTDKGRQALARAARGHGRGRTRAGVLA